METNEEDTTGETEMKSVPDSGDSPKEESHKAMHSYLDWKVGQLDARNEEIRNICGQTQNFIVYFVRGGWLNWFYDAVRVKGAHKLESAAQVLLNKGRSWIRVQKDFGEFRNIVAAGMVHGLSNLEDGKPFDGCFKDAEDFLRVRSKSTYQVFFVLTSVVATIISAGLLFSVGSYDGIELSELHRHLFYGGASGAYGALLSILVRASRLEPDAFSYASRVYVTLEALIRIGLGISFGFLLVLLQKAQVLISIANGNVYFMVLGAIVAGFSERMVPSLLSEMEGLYGLDRSGRPINEADKSNVA